MTEPRETTEPGATPEPRAMVRPAAINERHARLLAILVVLMPLLALLPKYLLIHHTLAGQSVEDTGFGFGDYVSNLLESGELRTCARPPFKLCQPDQCLYATRMPGLPLLYANLAHLLGDSSVNVDFAKCVLTALLLAAMLAVLMHDTRPTVLGVILLYALYFGPQALKHGAAIEYEEGVLLDLELSLAIAASYLLRSSLAATLPARKTNLGLIALALAVTMYFIKTTALLMLVVVAALFVLRVRASWRTNAVAAVLIVVPFALWGIHTESTSGTLHLSSSWNGENLFRGYNSDSLAIYPQVSLDRIFDSQSTVLDDGTRVTLGDYSDRPRCFTDEWAWSESYSQSAAAWLKSHPMDALRFNARKVWVALLEIRHTPYRISAVEKDPEYPRAVTLAMTVWMILARLISFFLLFRLARECWRGHRADALWTLALLGAAFAPYLIVFSYQRHVVPLLVMAGGLLVLRYFVTPRESDSAAVT